jgi:hypothetical protein
MTDPGRRVRRTRRGKFELRIPRHERDALRTLPAQLRQLLDSNDPALFRLFPPAYQDAPDQDAEYQRLVHEDLVTQRRSSLDVMEATIDARRLDEEQLTAWLGALNDLRLVLGTRLEVTEDMGPDDIISDDPRAPTLALYYYLGWLEEEVVEALASEVDPAGTADQ